MDLILVFILSGYISISSCKDNFPSISVPVTMVPKPDITKTLSIGSLGVSFFSSFSKLSACFLRIFFISSMPSKVLLETLTISEFSRKVPFKLSLMYDVTNSIHSSSTKSVLVKATKPCSTPSIVSMFKCSIV